MYYGMQVGSFPTFILDGHLHRVTYTRRCIDTIDSPDDEHEVARNIYRIETDVQEKELGVKLATYHNYSHMHGQQNIKVHYNFNITKINLHYVIPRTPAELSEADASLAFRYAPFS
jgi:hypothetical protein